MRWPTEMAVNPLDNTLYFVDDGVVAKVTSDGRLQVTMLQNLFVVTDGEAE